jgi:signal transduction histidine kinase
VFLRNALQRYVTMPVRLPLDAGTAKPKVITPSPSADAATLSSKVPSKPDNTAQSCDQLRSLNHELTEMNDQLRATLEQQRATSLDCLNVLHSLNIATILLDANLNIRLFTPASQALFSMLAADIGRPMADLCPMATDANLLEDASKVMRDMTPLEREVQSRSGLSFTRRISPYNQDDDFVEGVVITFTDICDKKHVTAALEDATHKAQLATADRTRFLASASHDLRQPLQTLKLLQGLLLSLLKDEQPRKLTVRIGETVGAMSGMLNALLDINHIEAGAIQATPVTFRISDLLDRLADEFRYKAVAKGLKLSVVPCHLSIESDPRLLEQVLRNLLSNALQYTHEGRILFGCRRHGGWLSIEADFLPWIQRGVRALEHHLHVFAQLLALRLVGAGHFLSGDFQGTGGRLLDQRQGTGQGGFAATRFAHDREGLAGFQFKRHTVQGAHGRMALEQATGHFVMTGQVAGGKYDGHYATS